MLKLACPPLRATVACVAVGVAQVPPSIKATLPAGVPLPGEFTVTVAVKVTDWFRIDGLGDELKAVEVAALLIVCVWLAEVKPVAEAVKR
jgi:hypothetical protein